MIDQAAIDRLRADTDLVALVARSVKLSKRGRDFWGCCPFHGEDTPSFKVSNERGTFKCFGCEAGGDAFEWVQKTQNCTFPEAVERLSNGQAAPFAPQQAARAASAKKKAPPVAIVPVPLDAPPAPTEHPSGLKPTKRWSYRNATGGLVGYVYRFDPEGKRKQFSPVIYTSEGWKWAGLPNPKPMYRLVEFLASPTAPVLLVEGEGKCDRIQALLPDYACVAWHGGAQAIKDTDWSPLAGRTLVCWPDNDDVGRNAMAQIVKLVGHGRIIEPPAGKAKGWDAGDAADEGWTTEQVRALLAPEPPPEPAEARGPMPPDAAYSPDGPGEEPPVFNPDDAAGEWPFGLLGHRHGTYFYLPNAGGTVIALGGASHSKNALMMLAPLSWWETAFSAFDKKGYDAAADALIRAQHRKGIYDPTRTRGRGAWWDEGRVVIHIGDRLIVDGTVIPIKEFKTDYLYEMSPKIRYVDAEPLDNGGANQLISLCKELSWERPISAYLLAGWCALAPICGALAWRPNIFLQGQAGSGKTWIYQNIICRTVGSSGYALASNVSEPGIRRALGSDAMPVMIDELESRGEMDAKRIEAIMGLMRYSSSETDAMIVKGSNSGAGVEFFKIRSMFCTVAIGSMITDYADATRNSVLSLKPVHGSHGEAKFARIEQLVRELLTDAWIDSLRSRIVRLVPEIRANAETFSQAGARVLGTRRLGDQMGTLLAGAYALVSRQRITIEQATAWIEQHDWSEEKEIIVDTDGPLCFQRIMEHTIMCETRQGGGHVKRSLGELMTMIAKETGDETVSRDTATAAARRCGVAYVRETASVAISNTHSEIGKILHDTPWSANWHRRLKTIKGSVSSPKAMSFGHATVSRAILVPWIAPE